MGLFMAEEPYCVLFSAGARDEKDPDDDLVAASRHGRLIDYVFFQASAAVNHEQAQAIARMLISSGIGALLALLWVGGQRGGDAHWLNLWVAATYSLFAVGYYAVLRRYRERHPWRRYLTILSDLGITSFCTYSLGFGGLSLYPLYLWIMIGNGLRFGVRYMRIAGIVGVSGFMAATLGNGLVAEHPAVIGGLLVGMLLMPTFFLVMVKRLAAANQQLLEQKARAEYRATHDELTGLPNRALLEDRLQLALKKTARRAGRIAVIFIDLDGFKAINDNFGHDAGDALLRDLADCLQQRLRASDTVARLGGDEFILLVEDCGSAEEVAAVIEQLMGCVGRYYGVGDYQTYVSWSCGVAMYPEDGTDAVTLIQHADTAMYQAKAVGHGHTRFYDDRMTAQVASQLGLRDELRRALEQREFLVQYQPLVALPQREVVAIVALVCWQHPERGLVEPMEFAAVAEQTGLIVELGRRVLQQVTSDLAGWRRRGFAEDLPVQVSVSPRQLLDGSFLGELLGLLGAQGLTPAAVGIEVTENLLLNDTAALHDLFQGLRDSGVTLSLAGFGSGHASLKNLRGAPIDRIKIDRVFVNEIPVAAIDCALVEALLALGARLGIDVVVEGVERAEQERWLIAAGCRYGQGNLYGRPVPADALPSLLIRVPRAASGR